MFADLVLPLAISGAYSYLIPTEFESSIVVGSRVLAPVKNKIHTGIVIRIYATPPKVPADKLRPLLEIVDAAPLISEAQIQFWRWMADYYLCYPGEVVIAALPNGLKLESQSQLTLAADVDTADESLSPVQQAVLRALATKPLSIHELRKQLPTRGTMAAAQSLIATQKIEIVERISKGFQARSEQRYRISPAYQSPEARAQFVQSTPRSKQQHALLHAFLALCQETAQQGPTPMEGHKHTTNADTSTTANTPTSTAGSADASTIASTAADEAANKAVNNAANEAPNAVANAAPQTPTTAAAEDFLHLSLPRKLLNDRLPEAQLAALPALIRRGVIERFAQEVARLNHHYQADPRLLAQPLSPAQEAARQSITQQWQDKRVVLLHGVTSSGKTEIYVKLIAECIARGEQVLFLLPEIALTTQITQRLGRRFGDQLGVYHSKFPDAQRVELWLRQRSSRPYPLILGVRSALFLPFDRLGLIIVDEEHEHSYKQQDPAPRYHARDAAIMLAQQSGARVLLGTATPSIESYTNALEGKFGLVQLTERYGQVRLPEIFVEDLSELYRKKRMPTPLSPRLREETTAALARGEQAIYFLNRRGYSPSLQCRRCGWSPRCQRCDVALTLHQQQGKLLCHYCGAAYDIPHQCPQCQHTELRDVGAGTEKIETTLHEAFPTARVARMDLDTTRSRSAYEQLIADFQSGRSQLLVGTQMVTKGLDFEGVSLVGILNADQMLNQCDFRAHEHAYQMMTQVAGRAGRRQRQGRVVLQTRQPDLPIIAHIVRSDYEAMYRTEMADRHQFRFPPAVRLIAIHLSHRDEAIVTAAARHLGNVLRSHFADDLLGPIRPSIGFIQLLHLRKMLLKVDARYTPSSVRTTLRSARDWLLSQSAFKTVRCYFDVDPL